MVHETTRDVVGMFVGLPFQKDRAAALGQLKLWIHKKLPPLERFIAGHGLPFAAAKRVTIADLTLVSWHQKPTTLTCGSCNSWST